jgi:hypothetical protein
MLFFANLKSGGFFTEKLPTAEGVYAMLSAQFRARHQSYIDIISLQII